MKILITQLLFLSMCFAGIAQTDTIYFKNGQKKAVQITEITKKEIKFRTSISSESPVIIINKKDIDLVYYKNSTYSPAELGSSNPDKETKEPNYKKFIVNLDLAQPAILRCQFGADYFFTKKGNIGISVYFNRGINKLSDSSIYNGIGSTNIPNPNYKKGYYKQEYFGLDLKLLEGKPGKINYLSSIGLELGSCYTSASLTRTFLIYQGPYYQGSKDITSNFLIEQYFQSFHWGNGIFWQVTKHFCIQSSGFLKIERFRYPGFYKYEPTGAFYHLRAGFSLGAGLSF